MTTPAALTPPSEFLAAAAALGIEFEPGELDRLGLFLAVLLQANITTNLTAITDPAQAWMKHVLDALTIIPVLESLKSGEVRREEVRSGEDPASVPHDSPPLLSTQPLSTQPSPSLSVIDIGSGGGVPALPLAIVMPHARFTLVEATGKKAEYLDHAISSLNLSNARVIQARAENVGQDHRAHREVYDAAIARALGHLAIVAELCGPLVRPGGVVVAVKGAKAEQEVGESAKAFGLIGLRHVETIPTPTGRLVVLEKTTRTPRTYPRRDGEPARLPLGVEGRGEKGEGTGNRKQGTGKA